MIVKKEKRLHREDHAIGGWLGRVGEDGELTRREGEGEGEGREGAWVHCEAPVRGEKRGGECWKAELYILKNDLIKIFKVFLKGNPFDYYIRLF